MDIFLNGKYDFIINLLHIPRERGESHVICGMTDDGRPCHLSKDGTPIYDDVSVNIREENGSVYLDCNCSKEMPRKRILSSICKTIANNKQILAKYGIDHKTYLKDLCKNFSLDNYEKIMTFPRSPIRISLDYGDENFKRALLKIVFLFFLYKHPNVTINDRNIKERIEGRISCGNTIRYCYKKDPFFHYGKDGIYHSIYVRGLPEIKKLVAIVDLFSFTPYTCILDEDYNGDGISATYGYDLICQKESSFNTIFDEDIIAECNSINFKNNKLVALDFRKRLNNILERVTHKQETRCYFLQVFFDVLNRFNIPYAVLRNWGGLPNDSTSRDIDVFLPKSYLKLLKNVLDDVAKETNCALLYENWDNQFWTVVYADYEANVFQLDFQYNFAWMGIDLLDEEEVLKHRVFNGKVWHTDPLYAFLPKYLYCRILGGKYPEKYAAVRQAALEANGGTIEKLLKKLSLGKGGLDYWDKTGKWSLRLRAFTAVLLQRPFRALWEMLCFIGIYIWQLFTRRGWMISFSGPDGCGKTTVINLVMEKLSVNPPHLFHFRPTLFPNLGEVGHKAGIKKDVDRNFNVPHRAKRCGMISSLVRLAYYMSDYVIGYWLKIMPIRWRKSIVFFDRYFTDIIVDSERSSIFLPYKFLCWLRHLVPSCQKTFLIRVKPETILERKQELTRGDIEVIYERLEYLAARDKTCVWIDNNSSADEAAKDVILELRRRHF